MKVSKAYLWILRGFLVLGIIFFAVGFLFLLPNIIPNLTGEARLLLGIMFLVISYALYVRSRG